MKTIEVITRVYLYNPQTGETASAYGACPPGFELATQGYTWRVTDARGSMTVGLGRRAVDTASEANEIADAFAAKREGWTVIKITNK